MRLPGRFCPGRKKKKKRFWCWEMLTAKGVEISHET